MVVLVLTGSGFIARSDGIGLLQGCSDARTLNGSNQPTLGIVPPMLPVAHLPCKRFMMRRVVLVLLPATLKILI